MYIYICICMYVYKCIYIYTHLCSSECNILLANFSLHFPMTTMVKNWNLHSCFYRTSALLIYWRISDFLLKRENKWPILAPSSKLMIDTRCCFYHTSTKVHLFSRERIHIVTYFERKEMFIRLWDKTGDSTRCHSFPFSGNDLPSTFLRTYINTDMYICLF